MGGDILLDKSLAAWEWKAKFIIVTKYIIDCWLQ